MASLSVFTTVILVCPAVLQRIPSTPLPTSSSVATGSTSDQASTPTSLSLATTLSSALSSTSYFPTSTLSGLASGMTSTPSIHTHTRPHVLVPIHTTVTVDIFPDHLPTLEGYVPTYRTHADGSLVTTLFEKKVDQHYLELMAIGIYLTVFAYTLWKSFSYLRRAGPRARSVFSALCISQLLGLVAVTSVSVGYLDDSANCQAINLVASISGEISYALIITGILGFKVYRILERPRWLLGSFLLLQSLSIGLFAADLPGMGQSRSFTGECKPTRMLHYIPYSMIVMFVEIALITASFLFAIHKVRRRWTGETLPNDVTENPGWWRRPSLAPFIRRNTDATVGPQSFSDTPSARNGTGNRLHRIVRMIRHRFVSGQPETPKRKTSDVTMPQGSARSNSQRSGSARTHRFTRMTDGSIQQQQPPTPPPSMGRTTTSVRGRTPSGILENGIFVSSEKAPSLVVVPIPERNSTPRPHSIESEPARARPRPRVNVGLALDPFGRLSRAIPTRFIHSSRTIFRRVLRDELLSTAAISIVIFLSTLASFLGTWSRRLLIGRSLLLDGGWAFTSVLVLRSFGGVIRRAERSALLREHWENMNTNRAGTFDPTRQIPGSTLSSLVFANPEEITELYEPAPGGITWREPFENPNVAADIEAWRREPRYSVATTGTTPSRFLQGLGRAGIRSMNLDDGEISPKATGQGFSQSQSRRTSTGPSSGRPTSQHQTQRSAKMSPPSLSSYPSYWATKSTTTDAALDALRRPSVVPSLSTLYRSHHHEHEHENDADAQWGMLGMHEKEGSATKHRQELDNRYSYAGRDDNEDEDVTPTPAARMHITAPRTTSVNPSAAALRSSILRRSRIERENDIEAAAESIVISTSRPSSLTGNLELRHSRALSAPNLIPNAIASHPATLPTSNTDPKPNPVPGLE